MLKSSRSICCPRKRSNTAKHKPVLRSGREGSKTFQILVCCHSPDENVTWGEQSTQLPAWAMSDTTTAIYERLPPLSVIPYHWTHILCLHNSSKHSFQSENRLPLDSLGPQCISLCQTTTAMLYGHWSLKLAIAEVIHRTAFWYSASHGSVHSIGSTTLPNYGNLSHRW